MNALLAGLFALAAAAQEKDAKEELKQLDRDFQKAQQAYSREMQAAKTDEERSKVWREKRPEKEFMPKYKDLAARHKGTETAAAALAKAFQFAWQGGEWAEARETMDELVASHSGAPQLENAVSFLTYGGTETPLTWREKVLRAVAEKSPHEKVRAAALFTLARCLSAVAKRSKEAKELFEKIREDYAKTSYAKRAEGEIFELENLQVGMVAPDQEAIDQDGKKFKLTDYRGKVVVIDFWGFW